MSRPRLVSGFTLIEILVVVTIIAIVMSVAMLSLTLVGDDRDSRTEARRLASLLEVALDESIMQGREFGVELVSGGYRFVEYDRQTLQWAEIPGDDTLRPRNLPDGVVLELFMEDQRVVLDEEMAEITYEDDDDTPSPDDRRYAPHVFVFSSGDVTPFRVHIARSNLEEPVILEVDALGQAEIKTEEDL